MWKSATFEALTERGFQESNRSKQQQKATGKLSNIINLKIFYTISSYIILYTTLRARIHEVIYNSQDEITHVPISR